MCYAVFIATSSPLQTSEFSPGVNIYLQVRDDETINALKDKFTLPYIYYVGSDEKCSCGFIFHSESFDDPEWQAKKESPQALLDLFNELTIDKPLEYYCCWEGDWAEPIEEYRTLNSRDMSLEKDYFGIVERELILFEKAKSK